jgi:hypothetical protein
LLVDGAESVEAGSLNKELEAGISRSATAWGIESTQCAAVKASRGLGPLVVAKQSSLFTTMV